jgi:hypothetical protein
MPSVKHDSKNDFSFNILIYININSIYCFFIYVINNENSIQFFIIYVPSQQLQGQLQAQHSVDTGNYIMDRHNMKTTTMEEENTLIQKK